MCRIVHKSNMHIVQGSSLLMPEMTRSILDELVAFQLRHGWSDRQFAERLGVSNGLWSAVRRKRKRLGRKVLQGAASAFPELQPLLASYWLQELGLPVSKAQE